MSTSFWALAFFRSKLRGVGCPDLAFSWSDQKVVWKQSGSMLLLTTSEDQHSCSLWILEGHCTAPVFRCLGAPAMAPVQLAPKGLKHELRFSMKHPWTQHERDEWQNKWAVACGKFRRLSGHRLPFLPCPAMWIHVMSWLQVPPAFWACGFRSKNQVPQARLWRWVAVDRDRSL